MRCDLSWVFFKKLFFLSRVTDYANIHSNFERYGDNNVGTIVIFCSIVLLFCSSG